MSDAPFHETLSLCRDVIADHIPDPTARLDFDSCVYANSMQADLKVVFELLPPGAWVLDIGCGKGHISALLAEAGYNVIGIDVSSSPGEQLEIQSAQWQRPIWQTFQTQCNVRYGYYNGAAIPLANDSLDAVLSYAVLEHVDPAARQSFLQGIVRVLRPGGYLLIFKCPRRWALAEHIAAAVGLPHHSLLVAERQLRDWLESAGLTVSQLERTDMLPAFPPRALQGCWNRLAPFLNIAEHILRRTPWKLAAHHLRVVAQKPTQTERQVNP
jgi:2-polyprenyl-3-methyl-5-hydroxy-6-metoxy-1,4-benzoquinol methylase